MQVRTHGPYPTMEIYLTGNNGTMRIETAPKRMRKTISIRCIWIIKIRNDYRNELTPLRKLLKSEKRKLF